MIKGNEHSLAIGDCFILMWCRSFSKTPPVSDVDRITGPGRLRFGIPGWHFNILLFDRRPFKYIDRVLGCLRNHNLKLKPSKCEFFQKETQYLGFNISENMIPADFDKIKAIQSIATTTTVQQVRSFIGITYYYPIYKKVFWYSRAIN